MSYQKQADTICQYHAMLSRLLIQASKWNMLEIEVPAIADALQIMNRLPDDCNFRSPYLFNCIYGLEISKHIINRTTNTSLYEDMQNEAFIGNNIQAYEKMRTL